VNLQDQTRGMTVEVHDVRSDHHTCRGNFQPARRRSRRAYQISRSGPVMSRRSCRARRINA
jgi:hypothetical protein